MMEEKEGCFWRVERKVLKEFLDDFRGDFVVKSWSLSMEDRENY